MSNEKMSNERMNNRKKPFFFAICGFKNSGKTTMMEQVIQVLTQRGYRVATIKHDGHDFEGDVPGTDSYRHHAAGAYGSAVYSADRFLIQKECKGVDELMLAEAFPEADIILLEGFKNSGYPKYWCDYPREPLKDPSDLADEILALMKEGDVMNNRDMMKDRD